MISSSCPLINKYAITITGHNYDIDDKSTYCLKSVKFSMTLYWASIRTITSSNLFSAIDHHQTQNSLIRK